MRFAWILAALLILGPIWAHAPLADETGGVERPVSGLITSLDPNAGILQLGPMVFHVPEGVHDLEELEEGMRAVVHFTRDGTLLVATSIEANAAPQ